MARPYSLDLRERMAAARFGVSVASVVRWFQSFRATGSAAAKPMGGRRPYASLRVARPLSLPRRPTAPPSPRS